MKTIKKTYTAPMFDSVEISVERGIADSGGSAPAATPGHTAATDYSFENDDHTF